MTLEGSLRRLWILSQFMLFIVLASCSTLPPANSVKSYLDVKREYVAALEQSSDWGPRNYRLAIIPPLVEPYPPGTPLLKGSYEALTNECRIVSGLTISEELADPPVSSYETAFDVSLGIPEIFDIRKVVDFQIKSNANETAIFSMSLSKSVTSRRDVLKRAMLNEACFNSVVGLDIVMVRGLIYGSEAIATRQTLRADAILKVLDKKHIAVKYDSAGGYEVRDTVNKPKFWIISDLRIEVPGLTPLTSPNQRLKLIRSHLGKNLEGISFDIQAPTKATVYEFELKAPTAPAGLRLE